MIPCNTRCHSMISSTDRCDKGKLERGTRGGYCGSLHLRGKHCSPMGRLAPFDGIVLLSAVGMLVGRGFSLLPPPTTSALP